MKKFIVVACCMVVCAACAPPYSTVSAGEHGPAAAQDSKRAPATLCRTRESALFSCQVSGSSKIASLCASDDLTAQRGHVSYVYGTPTKIELRYLDSAISPSVAFQRTHLVYAGPTGAFAYSFSRAGVEYVLYSISGAQGFERQGILAYRLGASAPLANLKCEAASVVQSEDPELIDLTLKWPENPELAEGGLPF